MTNYRIAAKRDRNERMIIKALNDMSCKVWQLNDPGMPDLLVVTPDGRIVLIEVKSRHGRLTPAQVKRRAEGLPFSVVRTIKEATDAVGVMYA